MTIQIGDYNLHFQLAPLHGISVGYIYYAPDLEEDFDEETEDYYSRHQVLLLLFALIVNVWKS
jgi:hypothetical protein